MTANELHTVFMACVSVFANMENQVYIDVKYLQNGYDNLSSYLGNAVDLGGQQYEM